MDASSAPRRQPAPREPDGSATTGLGERAGAAAGSAPAVTGSHVSWFTRWPSIATVVGSLFVAWAWWRGLAPISDNSFFTHLVTGRLLADGTFPHHDPYSFTAAGDPWVVQSWLASLLYGLSDSWFGLDGVRVLHGILTGTIAGLVWMLTRPARGLIGRVICIALVVAVGASMWAPRPLLFGLVFLAVTLLCVEGRVPLPALLPVYWLWANTHGSFPLGLVAIGCFALGRQADKQDATQAWKALAWASGGTLAAVVGPLGLTVLTFPVELLGRQEVLRNVVEWKSPDFTDVWSRLFLVQVALSVVLLVRRPTYRTAVPLIVFTAAALLSQRNIVIASIVITPGLARSFRGIGSLDGHEAGVVARVGLVVVVLLGGLAGLATLSGPAFDLSRYPVQAVAYMDQQGLRGAGTRVLASDTVGNYLELIDGAEARVFLDDRFDMYPQTVVDDYMAILLGSPEWAEVLDRHEITGVLMPRTAPIAQILGERTEWRMAYQDNSWAVVCRRSTPGC